MNPRPFVERIVVNLPSGRALDLACGSGRNALWLSERGWDVTAVDSSAAALTALHQAAPSVTKQLADLEKHEFAIEEGAWDLIVMSYYLQRDLFNSVRRGLKPGGVAIIIVHMFEAGHESSRFSVHPGELRDFFPGQTILEYYEGKPDPSARAIARIAIRHQ